MEEDISDLECAILQFFCIGFAAGAGVLPYSKAEQLINKTVTTLEGDNG